ncbi:hypothetical protein ACHAWX_004316 [Stephanocyclus meneghinianus]
MLYCIASSNSMGRFGLRSSAAFSTLSERVALKLQDPSLVGDGVLSGETFDVNDPGASAQQFEDGSAVIARVRRMGRDDAKTAINRAHAALGGWRDGTTAAHRSAVLSKWSSLIKENTDDIATIMTMESGKPLHESRGEVSYGTSFLDYYAAEAIRPNAAGGGFITPTPFTTPGGTAPRGKVMAVNEAVGVCGLITPWNFPIAMITRKAGPAIGVGCTVVLKPSDLTPLTALALQTLAKRAGVPDGVFEIVTADRNVREVGEELCTNPLVKKISFTGSTPVGKLLMKMSSESVKRVSLELGGSAAFIVFEDADIDLAVNAAMASKFRNAGQTCVCADRFIIHKSVETEFVSKLTAKVKQLQVGHGMNDGVTMGPLISSAAVEKLAMLVGEAIAENANCVLGGTPLTDIGPHYFEPTILTNVSPDSIIFSAETFGPIVAITTFDTEEHALLLANNTTSGLAAYFCTKDMARVFRFSASLQNGIVGVNEGIVSTASAPFGGVKESGLGREGSALGINEYLETKYIFLNV